MSKTYLVTGASRGLGLEFVKRLLGRGDTVIAAARDTKSKHLAALTSGEHAGRLSIVELDVSDAASIAGLGSRVGDRAVDVLINNAGVSSESDTLGSLESGELQRVLMVNSIAPMLVTKAVFGQLEKGGGAGSKTIVQISSILGSIANNTGGSSYGYRASKAAINQFNKCLANEVGPKGFTCIVMHPGWVRTDMGGPNAHLSIDESVSAMIKTIDGLKQEKNGAFLNYDGTGLPW